MGRENGWSRELGFLVMKIEVLPPPCELLGSMEGITLVFAPFSWLTSHGTDLHSLTLTRALKSEMLPGKSSKAPVHFWQDDIHCTPRSCITSAYVFWSISEENRTTSQQSFMQVFSSQEIFLWPPQAHLTCRWGWRVHEEIFSEDKMALFPYGDVGRGEVSKKA